MINKKLCLILICAMGLGQVMAMDLDSLGDDFMGGSDASAVENIVIPDLELSVDGKLKIFPGGETDDATAVRLFLNRIKSNAADYKEEMTNDYTTFLGKSATLNNNSSVFRKKYQDNITKFGNDKKQVMSLASEIDGQIVKKLYAAIKTWQASIGMFTTDQVAKEKAMKEVQQYVDELAKAFKQIQSIAKQLSDEVALFDQAASADAAEVAVQNAKIAEADAAQKAEIARQQAEEENTKQAQVAAQKAEADAKTAKALARTKAIDALKKEAKYRRDKADQLDRNTQKVIERIASLRNLVQTKVTAINALINKVQDNTSNYPADFVSDVNSKVIPMVSTIAQTFDVIITKANNVSEKLSNIEAKIKEEDRGLSDIIGRGGDKETEDEIVGALKNLNLQLNVQFTLASKLLKQAEEFQKRLSNIHSALLGAEKGARAVNPQSVEHALELIRAVKIEQNQQRIISENITLMNSARKREMVIRILELTRAVKLA